MIEKNSSVKIHQIVCDGPESKNNIIGLGNDSQIYWWNIDTVKWYLLRSIKAENIKLSTLPK